jgi:hypothetical protein
MNTGLKTVVAAHLSEKNNTPELATNALLEVLEHQGSHLIVADPQKGTDWITVD